MKPHFTLSPNPIARRFALAAVLATVAAIVALACLLVVRSLAANQQARELDRPGLFRAIVS
ncbi:hypothetical protein ASA1KI_07070 [Opitutales bacterium ASA1]|uniref:hypothetical protein n=1 Tax=Congregicoccus parvus TaxID=3081749 RepID=UPI002B30F3DC|nr:hypothetical protein ASA1KI_07070 [Opitutales bacterium ASA1]